MKVIGEFDLKSMKVSRTLGDEFGIYFMGEGDQKQLAFAYPTAKKAISSIKNLSKVLGIKYNIEKEVLDISLQEKEEIEILVTNNIQKEGKKVMANKKRDVNVKRLCRDMISQGKEKGEILSMIASVYTKEGKDEKYANGRAWAVYTSICKEKGMAPPKKERKVKEKAAKKVVRPPVVAEPEPEPEEPEDLENQEVEQEESDTQEEVTE